MEPSCPLGTTRCIPQAKFHQKPYNKSFIDQVCSVKMVGYWPRSFFASLCSSRSINTQKKNLANIQPSWPLAWSITHTYSAKLQTKPTLTTSKHSTEFTYSDFRCHLKVNRDKLAVTNHRWMCKEGKRLTITANFKKRNLGTSVEREKNPARGPYRKKLDRSRV